MPYEYTPPKYAQVIDELRRRIESGEYPPGSLLPSEHQLSDEFQIARPTVVRALRVLRQDGWIETQQGKGSFVRGRPALAGLESPRTWSPGGCPPRWPTVPIWRAPKHCMAGCAGTCPGARASAWTTSWSRSPP